MMHYQLLDDHGIVILRSWGPLRADDFASLTHDLDPYLARHDGLNGLMIDMRSIPGWNNVGLLRSHLRFVRHHRKRICRVAIISDSKILALAPKIANHFLEPQIRVFDARRRVAAFSWIKTGVPETQQ